MSITISPEVHLGVFFKYLEKRVNLEEIGITVVDRERLSADYSQTPKYGEPALGLIRYVTSGYGLPKEMLENWPQHIRELSQTEENGRPGVRLFFSEPLIEPCSVESLDSRELLLNVSFPERTDLRKEFGTAGKAPMAINFSTTVRRNVPGTNASR